MNRISAPVAPPSQTTTSRLIASMYSSHLTRSWPSSGSPNSLNYGLQVHLRFHTISDSKSISKLAQSRPTSASLIWLDLSLQVHLQTCVISASECISEFLRSSSSGAQRLAPQHQLQPVQIELARSWPPSAFLSSIDPALQERLQTCQSQPPYTSLRTDAGVRRYSGNGGELSNGENIFGRPRGR